MFIEAGKQPIPTSLPKRIAQTIVIILLLAVVGGWALDIATQLGIVK